MASNNQTEENIEFRIPLGQLQEAWSDVRAYTSNMWQVAALCLTVLGLTVNVLASVLTSDTDVPSWILWMVGWFALSFLAVVIYTMQWLRLNIAARIEFIAEAEATLIRITSRESVVSFEKLFGKAQQVLGLLLKFFYVLACLLIFFLGLPLISILYAPIFWFGEPIWVLCIIFSAISLLTIVIKYEETRRQQEDDSEQTPRTILYIVYMLSIFWFLSCLCALVILLQIYEPFSQNSYSILLLSPSMIVSFLYTYRKEISLRISSRNKAKPIPEEKSSESKDKDETASYEVVLKGLMILLTSISIPLMIFGFILAEIFGNVKIDLVFGVVSVLLGHGSISILVSQYRLVEEREMLAHHRVDEVSSGYDWMKKDFWLTKKLAIQYIDWLINEIDNKPQVRREPYLQEYVQKTLPDREKPTIGSIDGLFHPDGPFLKIGLISKISHWIPTKKSGKKWTDIEKRETKEALLEIQKKIENLS